MPFTGSFPFKRLMVDHLVYGITRLWWEMDRSFHDPEPHSFQLQASMSGAANAVDWEDVGSPVDGGGYAEDDERRLRGKIMYTHYRVKLVTPTNTYVSNPTGVFGELSQREWCLAREMVRKEQLRHRLVSRPGYLLRRLRFGEPCDRCRDYLTDAVTDSYCPICQGVGFKVGYHPPIPMACFDLSPQSFDEQSNLATPPGQTMASVVKARALGSPMVLTADVWVDAKSDQRWIVGPQISHAAALRGVPLILDLTLSLLPTSNVVYRVAVVGQTDASQELPDAGCGSVEVTHNYGGADALAYRTVDNIGIEGATVLAILKAQYLAGLRTPEYAVAATHTIGEGRWAFSMKLDPGEYVLIYERTGSYGPDTYDLSIPGSSSSSMQSSVSEFGV